MRNTSVLMVLNRRANLASTLGHIISFKKDEPVAVPKILLRDAINMGAVPADKSVDVSVKVAEDAPSQPIDLAERLEDIRAVISDMTLENRREDFTAAGTPVVKAVSLRVGYKVDRTEVKEAWTQRAIELAEANDT